MSLTKREFRTELIDARSLFQETTQADHLASGHPTDNSLFLGPTLQQYGHNIPVRLSTRQSWPMATPPSDPVCPTPVCQMRAGCVGAIKQYQSYGANQH